MEFRIQKTEFLRGLRLAQGIADRKSTMPVLANVLLRTAGKNKVLLVATDLNVSISADLTVQSTVEGGITLGAKALHDIVSNLPGDEVAFRRGDNNFAHLSAGKVDYRLVGMPDRDFPKIPDHREVDFLTVDAGVLREMIDKTLFSVSSDESRFHLNGVLFECDGTQARMVSTDGHRLSKIDRALPGGPVLTSGVIVPKKGLVEIKRCLDSTEDDAQLAIKTPYLFLSAADICLAVKLIESQFPPYDQVIPKSFTRRPVVDRDAFLGAIKRAQLMSSETRGVRVQLSPGLMRISSDNPDVGEVREEIDAEYEGEPLEIGFNPKYVMDVLNQIATSRVALELNGELDPAVVRPADDGQYLGVVMPMRI
jgi:DNA polymerase-3 subunit beta